jgi:hypothetical protein
MRSGIAGVSFSITDRISLVADNPAIENADRITINRLQHDMAGAPGNGSWAYIVGTYDKDAARITSASI